MQRNSVTYAILFAAAVCIVCAVVVSTSAVKLRPRQLENIELDRKKNVLMAAGIVEPGTKPSKEEIETQFAAIQSVAVDLRTGEEDASFVVAGYDQQKALSDPAASFEAPPNAAKLLRLPNHAVVYQLRDDAGRLEMLILPVEGVGLWSTLYGFLALESDLNTIRGLTFYQHGETPGLGGEVDNPRWKAGWEGRQAFDPAGEPVIALARGVAGSVADDPYHVDGLSGATLTARGVTELVQFWLGDDGFGPYLDRLAPGGA
jgi:Na+-transporting NADH:ubiquinone oxidoreductase subunit C